MEKSRRRLAVAAAATAALIGIACASGSDNVSGDGASESSSEEDNAKTVRYEVSGSGQGVILTYSLDGTGAQAQESNVDLPWSKEIQLGEDEFSSPYVDATLSESGGEVTCRILVDGKEDVTSTSKGQFASASCVGDFQF